jgi:hypothetical protein
MERKTAVTASMIVLMATLATTDAGAAVRSYRSRVPLSEQAARRLNSLELAAPIFVAEPNARRYHGGPKSNE